MISKFLTILICGSALAASEARVGTLLVGSITGGSGGGTPVDPYGTQDTWGLGGDWETVLEFVEVSATNAPAKTGTAYVWDPGAVPYPFAMMKYEMSYREASNLLALSLLPLTIRPAVEGVADAMDRPASKVIPIEPMLLANWLNTSKGYAPAYNIDAFYQLQVWPATNAWHHGGATNLLRNHDCVYFVPSLDEYFMAAQWDPVSETWKNYGVGDTDPPTSINGFYGGAAIPGTQVVSQPNDMRYPEYNYYSGNGNVINVTLTTSAGQITGVAYDSRSSGYSSNVTTTADYTITQSGGSGGKARVPTYQTISIPATFEIITAGTGYNSDWPHLTNGVGSITLGGDTMSVRVYAAAGEVRGIYPISGGWSTEDTTTEIDIVQAGGSGATCRVTRYVGVQVPATFGTITAGSGYSDGPATIKTGDQANIWQAKQPWQGAAPVTMAGGLSPWGAMGLDGNVHEFSDTEYDGVNDRVASITYGDRMCFFSAYYNYQASGWVSGNITEHKDPNEAIGVDDATYESGFRFARRILP